MSDKLKIGGNMGAIQGFQPALTDEMFQVVLGFATKEAHARLSFVESWKVWGAEYWERQANRPDIEGRCLIQKLLSCIQLAGGDGEKIRSIAEWYGHRVGMAAHYVYRDKVESRQKFLQGFTEAAFPDNPGKFQEVVWRVLVSQAPPVLVDQTKVLQPGIHQQQLSQAAPRKKSLFRSISLLIRHTSEPKLPASRIQVSPPTLPQPSSRMINGQPEGAKPVSFEKIDKLAEILLAHPAWHVQEGAFRVDDGIPVVCEGVEKLLREGAVERFDDILCAMASQTRIDREYLTVLKRLIRCTQGQECQDMRIGDEAFFNKTPHLSQLFRAIANTTNMKENALKRIFTDMMGAVSNEYWDKVFRRQRFSSCCQVL